MSLEPGQKFGRYEIAELLGKGGMGEVYRAHDTLLDRRVALKVMRASPDPGDTPEAEGTPRRDAARILREARAAAGIEHPNAIAIYDVGEISDVPFMAMELVQGSSLRPLGRDPGVPLGRRIRWLVDVARALGAAHALGIVHRDIKPENVMVRDDGVVKVLDFGIARRTRRAIDPRAASALSLGTLTGEGLIVGTPVYMAPEQMRGDAIDGRTDQFSWGVVAYELLTGALPWNVDDDPMLILAQVLLGEVKPATARNPEIPPEVDAVIRRALDKTPAGRFPTMEDVAQALEPYATRDESLGRPVDAGRAPSRPPEVALVATRDGETGRAVPLAVTPERSATKEARKPVARRALGALALAVVVGGASIATWRGRARTFNAQVATPEGAVADGGPLSSSNPDAIAAYRAGMRAMRDGSRQTAIDEMKRAIELDHWFASAHLGAALLESMDDYADMPTFQARLRDARAGRAALGPRDLALLDALEPWALVPPDLEESQRRFEAAIQKFPDDAVFLFELGIVRYRRGDMSASALAFKRVAAIDPSFAVAFWMLARVRIAADDVPGAVVEDQKCLQVSPGASICLGDLARLQAIAGRCEEMVDTTRRMMALAPDTKDAVQMLPSALAGAGQSTSAIHAALEQRWRLFGPTENKRHQLEDEATLATLTGDFARASALFQKCEAEAASSPKEMTHFVCSYGRMLVGSETGEDAEVLKVGEEHLRSRAAWQPNSLGIDPAMIVYAMELAAGGITRERLATLRAQWKPGESVDEGYAWAIAWALPAETREEAEEALAAVPHSRPLISALAMTPDLAEPIGRVYLLTGHLDEAIPLLRQASDSCTLLSRTEAIYATRASLELGEALESAHDAPHACLAYQRVLDRWGKATPPSKTATEARARARRLRCAASP